MTRAAAQRAVRRRLLGWMSLAPFASIPHARAKDDELARLFSEFGARRERHARFTERKFSALLKAPVESSGRLSFRAPDVLEKRTIEPQSETVRIEGDVVIYEGAVRGSVQNRTFALSDAPLLAALIESLRATLAGDLATLRRHYDVSWSRRPAPGAWQLTLVPRDRSLRDAVAKVVLTGAGNDIGNIEIVEANGDLTLMQLTPLPADSPAKK